MSSKKLAIAVALVCLLTIGAGWIDGVATNRWGTPVDLQAAGAGIDGVAEEFGDWRMESSRPLDESAVALLQCAGNWSRTYVNVVTGESVEVSLIVGPAGPTAAHTPEICMSSRDFVKLAEPEQRVFPTSGGGEASLWHSRYQASSLDGRKLDVFYGWAYEPSDWNAPTWPRLAYAGRPLLCKVQIAVSPIDDSKPGAAAATVARFVDGFLPAVDRQLLEKRAG